MAAYQAYFNGDLQNYDYPEVAIKAAMQDLPNVIMPA
jgi:hypothetical protein